MHTIIRRSTERHLLCRPHGGLNDTLGVIAAAWAIADETGRRLVVDGRASHFARDLSLWFEPRDRADRIVLHPGRRLRRRLDAGSCHPEVMTGRLDRSPIVEERHPTISWLEARTLVDAATGTDLTLNSHLARTLHHDVVLLEAYGGGLGSLAVLERVRLTPRAARRVERRIAHLLDRDYVGVQIRNSDLQTDHRSFLASIADELADRDVLVCSDDGDVLRSAQRALPRSRVMTTSAPPSANGRPYQVGPHTDRRRREAIAIDTLVDLFALAGASEVRTAPVVNRTDPTTGFGALAAELVHRPDLVDTLLRRRRAAQDTH